LAAFFSASDGHELLRLSSAPSAVLLSGDQTRKRNCCQHPVQNTPHLGGVKYLRRTAPMLRMLALGDDQVNGNITIQIIEKFHEI
jgi:hypothetical protein